MANIKSAKKRINTNQRQRSENKYVKSTLNTYVKGFRKLIAEGKIAEAESKLADTVSYINSACSKGVLHKNNASRKISRLSAALHKAKANGAVKEEVKVEAPVVEEVKVEAEVKAPAKKTAAKKVTATEEKPAAKKTTTKKATTKKAETK